MSNDATTFLILRLVNSRAFKLSLFSRCFPLVFRVEKDQLLFWRFSFLLLLFILSFFFLYACLCLSSSSRNHLSRFLFFFLFTLWEVLDIVPLSLFSTLASSLSLVHMPRRGGCGLYNSGKCKFQESPDEHNGFRKRILKKKKKRLLGRKTVVCRQRKAAMWVFVVVFLSRGNRQSVA